MVDMVHTKAIRYIFTIQHIHHIRIEEQIVHNFLIVSAVIHHCIGFEWLVCMFRLKNGAPAKRHSTSNINMCIVHWIYFSTSRKYFFRFFSFFFFFTKLWMQSAINLMSYAICFWLEKAIEMKCKVEKKRENLVLYSVHFGIVYDFLQIPYCYLTSIDELVICLSHRFEIFA